MKVTLTPSAPRGKIKAIASKSAAHRLLICAAFADRPTELVCEEINEDISATVRCLNALGAKISRKDNLFIVLPVKNLRQSPTLDCGESGSTMRFLVPVVAALGCGASFKMSGRLPSRPLSPLREELERHGITFSEAGSNPLTIEGKIGAGEYRIRGDVSSQFISGLLFALSLLEGESRIIIEGKTESAPYINMTLDALYEFGAEPERCDDGFVICCGGNLRSPEKLTVEGDWSGAAFALCAGAISKGAKVSVCSLDPESTQGDRAIIELLVRFGADVRRKGDCFTVCGGELCGMEIDASNIPDLVPILSVVAAAAKGQTVIYGASRLKIKESDRLSTVTEMLTALGADISKTDDGLIINGGAPLRGGEVSSCGDHRIAMSAAIAATIAEGEVTIRSAEAAAKSYPTFWDDIAALGVSIIKEED
ncbi:MAG: 3-phosphoshikimate 1-carboxyvinyltransferase [Ruminococcaceae bacterium]|nr:3-phosphoshikimate 1-carboxyvinyltransferase [Oscillospiraceae bacterium]